MAEGRTAALDFSRAYRARSVPDSAALATTILETAPGCIRLIGGIGSLVAQACLETAVDTQDGPIACVFELDRIAPAEAVIEDILRRLAALARECWPVWYKRVDFFGLRQDGLGREAARLKLSAVAAEEPRLSQEWARAAVALVQRRRLPLPASAHWSIAIGQLCLAIHPCGLVLVLDAAALPDPPEALALVHALELVATKAGCAVVVLCAALPDFVPPYDRILAEAVTAAPRPPDFLPGGGDVEGLSQMGLAPVSGRPHPLSTIEKRVAQAIARAPDLAPLFRFNAVVETLRGARPRVDLLWCQGRLVVELDGYADHTRRASFIGDRHRDYELTLSGYTVLRLANDEVHQDVEKAIDKIRDLVAYVAARRRSQ